MSPPAAMLFDLDGVLIDSERVWREVMNATARHFSVPEIAEATFDDCFGQGIVDDRDKFYPGRSLEEIAARYDVEFPRYLHHLRVDPAVPRVFEVLRERGLPSAVVTNTPNPLATDLVRRAEATPDHVIGGSDTPNPKPAPDMVLLACERLGVAPGEALLIGDSRYDREAAHAAGTPFVGLGLDGGVARVESLIGLLDHL
ncbi:MAG: HAD family hydrolase [Myxococcota bacterium]|nr:HAD family hydrolase [Myxococcota bacterium]